MSTALKPGWLMSHAQHDLFWQLWNSACRAQGWTSKEAVAKRREILSELGFASAKLIDHRHGFDHVRERLEALADILRNERPDAGQRRRLLWNISQAQAELSAANYPARSTATLFKIRFKIIPGQRVMDDLTTGQLLNLLRTLRNRLASWKSHQTLLAIILDILQRLATFKAWPASAAIPSASVSTATATASASASARQTLCSPIAAEMQTTFFVGK